VGRGQCIPSCWLKCRERDRLGDLGLNVWIVLESICGARALYMFVVGKPEVKRPLERPRRRWVENTRMNLRDEGCL